MIQQPTHPHPQEKFHLKLERSQTKKNDLRPFKDYFKIIRDYFKDSASTQLKLLSLALLSESLFFNILNSMMILTKKMMIPMNQLSPRYSTQVTADHSARCPVVFLGATLVRTVTLPCPPGFRKRILRHLVPCLRFVISHPISWFKEGKYLLYVIMSVDYSFILSFID